MIASRKLAVAAALSCALAGCSDIDVGQARTCRSVIPALNPAQATFKIRRTLALAHGEGVRIDYGADVPGRPPRDRFLECRFAQRSLVAKIGGGLSGCARTRA
jgi:hypothetical protein